MCSSRPQRANVVIDALEQIKSRFAYRTFRLHTSTFATHDADAIVGCTTNIPVITEEMVTVMKRSGIVIDLGKGTIFPKTVICNELGSVSLVDIYAAIIGMVISNTATKRLVTEIAGRKEVDNGLFFVAGGILEKSTTLLSTR